MMRSDKPIDGLRLDQGLRLPQWSSNFRFGPTKPSAGADEPSSSVAAPPAHQEKAPAERTLSDQPIAHTLAGPARRVGSAPMTPSAASAAAPGAGTMAPYPPGGHPPKTPRALYNRPHESQLSLLQSPLRRGPIAAGGETPRSVRKTPMTFRKTPGSVTWRRAVGDGLGRALNAETLRELPNATQAEFWINRASGLEERDDLEEAEAVLREGLRRRAQPRSLLEAALESLLHARAAAAAASPEVTARELSFACETGDSGREEAVPPGTDFTFSQENLSPEVLGFSESGFCGADTEPAPEKSLSFTPYANCSTPILRRPRNLGTPGRVKTPATASRVHRELKALTEGSGALPQPDAGEGPAEHGTLQLLTPVRATVAQSEELGSDMVLTQVRRSARKPAGAGSARPDVDSMLEQCNFSYIPNFYAQALKESPGIEEEALDQEEGKCVAKEDAVGYMAADLGEEMEMGEEEELGEEGVAAQPVIEEVALGQKHEEEQEVEASPRKDETTMQPQQREEEQAGEEEEATREEQQEAPQTISPPRTRRSARKSTSACVSVASEAASAAATDLAERLEGVSLQELLPTPLRRSSRLRKQPQEP